MEAIKHLIHYRINKLFVDIDSYEDEVVCIPERDKIRKDTHKRLSEKSVQIRIFSNSGGELTRGDIL